MRLTRSLAALAAAALSFCAGSAHAQQVSGAIFTTDQCGQRVNGNIYGSCPPTACEKTAARSPFLNGGPPPNAPCDSAGLPPGMYYFQVTNPNGEFLMSTDDITNRMVIIDANQHIVAHTGTHITGPGQCAGSISVALWPFDATPNPGGVYKTWMTRVEDYNPADPQSYHGFIPSLSKTDNFKCTTATPGQGACCIPSSATKDCKDNTVVWDCVITTQADCLTRGGCYQGDDTACDVEACPAGPAGFITLFKYYDPNTSGAYEPATDSPLNGIRMTVEVRDATGALINLITPYDPAGNFFVSGVDGPGTVSVQMNTLGVYPYTVTVCEILPTSTVDHQWINTDPALVPPCKTITLNTPADTATVQFGNVCIGVPGGGHTMGFWSNRNGRGILETCNGGIAANMQALTDLCLRNADGSNFDPNNYNQYRAWLLSANATNMAYMLSAQLSAMTFNIRNAACMGQFGGGVTNPDRLIFAPGTTCANAIGFATLSCVVTEANNALCANGNTIAAGPDRTHQGALKDAIDNANNNLNFVGSEPCAIIYK